MEKKFKIETTDSSPIKLPQGYSTDLELEKQVVDLINTEDPNWVEKINKDNIKIYSKPIENSYCVMLKGEAIIDYPYNTVYQAVTLKEYGEKWNSQFYNYEESEITTEGDLQKSLYYMAMKFPWPLADRDFVQNRYLYKKYGNDKSCLTLWQSVKNDKYPEKSKPVRAEMMMNAQYLKEINEKQTQIYLLNFADVKINSTMQGLVNRQAPGSQEKYIRELIAGCKTVK